MKLMVETLPLHKEDCIFSSPLYGTSERFCVLARNVCNLHEEFNEIDCNGLKCIADQTESKIDECEICQHSRECDVTECKGCCKQTEPSLEQFRVGLEYHTDATHFGKAKGESITTDKIEQTEPQTDCDHKCAQTEVGCEQTDCAWK